MSRITRTVVVGDVHGCLEELDQLLVKLRLKPDDRLVFCGDLIDRGPDPVGVVRRVRELGAVSVQGNHCEKHLRYRRHAKRALAEPGYKNPMRPMFGPKLEQHNSFSEADWHFMEAMPLYIRIDNWVVLHAGLQPGIQIEAQKPNVLVRMRYLKLDTGKMLKLGQELADPATAAFWSTVWTGPENVIYGHHVHRGVAIDEPAPGVKCIGIDTGCVFGRSLTAAVLEDGTLKGFVDVPAKDTYYKRWENDEDD